ncbi:DUF2786 domain-containing protein [Microlunatus aurantiacus]
MDDEAGALLARLMGWARAKTNQSGFSRLVGRELSGVPDDLLAGLDALVSADLLATVGRLWEHGWQPRDLLHVAGRLDTWSSALAADVALEQVRRSPRAGLAPPAWREQLDAAADQARAADLGRWPTGGDWRAVDRLVAAGVPSLSAWAGALRLLVRLGELPPLTRTLPPPSAWRTDPTPTTTSGTPPPGTPPPGTPPPRTTGSPPGPGPSRDKVLGTIRALLAKAESTEFAAEAEALSGKAQAMMTRHAIDEALLHAGDLDDVEVVSHRVLIDSPYPAEKVHLLSAVGRANRTRVVWADELAMATVVGTPVDVDQVELLFVSLLIQSTRAMAEAGTADPGSFDRSPRFRRAFLTAYAVRIGERLNVADAETTAAYGSELVPVLRRQEEAVAATYERLFPHTREMSSTRSYDRQGWEAGRRAADRASFVAGRLTG